MSQDTRKEIAKAKYIVGTPIQEIANSLQVNRRTIERWAADGKWSELKKVGQASNIVSFAPPQKIPKVEVNRRSPTPENLELIDHTLLDLHVSMPGAADGVKGSMATAIARLIELKRKIKPESIAELADRAIKLGFGPDDFMAELKRAWQRRA